jgi:murein DD-endopeptidase MepM/ murein hydrolase activator NlpD
MTTARARAACLLSALLLVLALAVPLLSQPAHAAQLAAAAAPAPADSAHPYTDPVWWPLRNPAKVGCVYNNCPGPYHGYWAIDFRANLDDPIYAAGGGVFHIGAVNNTCPASGNSSGTWVWIDHGPAGATIYEHLNRVLATEGQLVTPGTEIGTMGHNGNTAPCTVNYLHMEWRAERLGGTRQPIPALRACVGGATQSFPTALGYSSWNSIPNVTVTTPTASNACLPTSSWGTPDRPTITVSRSSGTAVVTPSARPASADAWRDRVEEYFPSKHAYLLIGYHNHYPTTNATTLTGLTNGRTYRFSASFHNASGWSAWAPTVAVIVGGVPSVPVPLHLSSGVGYTTYSWARSSSSTTTATYEVARRCYWTGAWHAWVFTTAPGTNTSYTWHTSLRHTLCEVSVKAHNSIGWSAWAPNHYTTTG